MKFQEEIGKFSPDTFPDTPSLTSRVGQANLSTSSTCCYLPTFDAVCASFKMYIRKLEQELFFMKGTRGMSF